MLNSNENKDSNINIDSHNNNNGNDINFADKEECTAFEERVNEIEKKK